eukprot:TRINITY_DN584_c0_g1_i1.p1 TRINITY_DN584_c0_g1~~TRINITY_DN584_c0_g1_i1.p1  ORF type:complete len:1314 (-),score=331.34 TRINITY_DN584_c0_g1_i1:549-4436(-)
MADYGVFNENATSGFVPDGYGAFTEAAPTELPEHSPYALFSDESATDVCGIAADGYSHFDQDNYVFDVQSGEPVHENHALPATCTSAAQRSERNWNEEYQRLVDTHTESPQQLWEKYHDLNEVITHFVETAKEQGRIVISEVSLPVEQKTIPPADFGGIAGGSKYFSQGVFFKFVKDESGLYASDAKAMKVAGAELLGLRAYTETAIPGLHFPLMTIIDFRGYRLIASCMLPLNKTTLVYGSADGGRTVHVSDEEMNALMQRAGEALHLKPHAVGDSGTVLYAPCDIEGHRGTDGRHYVLDTARVFPPETPLAVVLCVLMPKSARGALRIIELPVKTWRQTLSELLGWDVTPESVGFRTADYVMFTRDIVKGSLNKWATGYFGKPIYGNAAVVQVLRGHHLYNLLRPELLSRLPTPLSPDAFSWFGRHDANKHNPEVRAATLKLIHDAIPKLSNEFYMETVVCRGTMDLRKVMHDRGINMRFLGLVRYEMVKRDAYQHAYIVDLLLTDMITRVCKALLAEQLRAVRAVSDQSYKQTIIAFFNLVLGRSDMSRIYWRTKLRVSVALKFGWYGQIFARKELSPYFDFRSYVLQTELWKSLSRSIGVVFNAECHHRLQKQGEFFSPSPFALEDLAPEVLTPIARPIADRSDMLLTIVRKMHVMQVEDNETGRRALSSGTMPLTIMSRSGVKLDTGAVVQTDAAANPYGNIVDEEPAAIAAPVAGSDDAAAEDVVAATTFDATAREDSFRELEDQLDDVLDELDEMKPHGDGGMQHNLLADIVRTIIGSRPAYTDDLNLLKQFAEVSDQVFGSTALISTIPRFMIAYRHYSTGAYDDALVSLTSALDTVNGLLNVPVEIRLGAYYLKGEILRAQQNYQASLDAFSEAVNIVDNYIGVSTQYSMYESQTDDAMVEMETNLAMQKKLQDELIEWYKAKVAKLRRRGASDNELTLLDELYKDRIDECSVMRQEYVTRGHPIGLLVLDRACAMALKADQPHVALNFGLTFIRQYQSMPFPNDITLMEYWFNAPMPHGITFLEYHMKGDFQSMVTAAWNQRIQPLPDRAPPHNYVASLASQIDTIRFFFLQPGLFCGEHASTRVLTSEEVAVLEMPVARSADMFTWVLQNVEGDDVTDLSHMYPDPCAHCGTTDCRHIRHSLAAFPINLKIKLRFHSETIGTGFSMKDSKTTSESWLEKLDEEAGNVHYQTRSVTQVSDQTAMTIDSMLCPPNCLPEANAVHLRNETIKIQGRLFECEVWQYTRFCQNGEEKYENRMTEWVCSLYDHNDGHIVRSLIVLVSFVG